MAMMSEFWWRNGQETRGMHWKSWESLCRPKASGGLGFKDLEAYNLALLGKQLWRMIKNPRSLMCRVFKSRYFRNTDPLNASLGSRPSYAWRSIHAAHKLIQHGARVVIGNGRDTKIWQERWIGAAPATMIKSVRRSEGNERISLADDMRVSALIRVNGKEWNLDLIERLFTTEVQEQILKIRPAGNYSRDTYSWEFTKTGHYTVKSGYWVQTNIVAPDKEVQEVIQPRLDGIYQQIWGLETSPKIKHFLWKCLSNALPVLNLKKEFPREDVEEGLVPWLLWRLWKNRNEFNFRGKDYDARTTVKKVWEDVMEWKSRNEVQHEEVKQPAADTPEVKWSPPDSMTLKCNTDGAWSKETGEGGVGWLLRNHQGLLLWAGAKKMVALRSAIESEAEAIRWAVQTVAGFGYRRVLVETDSQMLARMLNAEEEIWPVLAPIIQDISTSLNANEGFKVQYHPRSGNKSANRIAKETSTFTSIVPKLYSMVPMWLNSCVLRLISPM
ncbi:uncharacterized protein LOC125582987 [Brassica napus]|uniref:uncharacterized protein LOC125582987 n=1 Tax=Brassica napus TaxID=3708 RepID=UPI002078FC8D|nr:uncharacterized protein LOC125582987 [Brassica napus]